MNGRTVQIPYFPAGTEYEVRNADFFVRQGMAVPADDECRVACDMSDEQMQDLQMRYLRQARGILPDEWKHYEAGYMVGYNDEKKKIDALGNASNTWIKGPKWAEYEALLAEAVANDEDDE